MKFTAQEMKTQEMWGITERPNIQIIGINEGEESQVNVIDQIIQQDHKRKLSQTKERHTHTATRSKQRTKEKRQAEKSLLYATVKTPSTHNKESVTSHTGLPRDKPTQGREDLCIESCKHLNKEMRKTLDKGKTCLCIGRISILK